ncbi:MAG: hypothetical protein KF763_19215 [Cyclobacteriaceae bacterium]|nr:hypothetical protein [Cyclobacteriaceae bacterium]
MAFVFGKVYAQKRSGVPSLSGGTRTPGESHSRPGERVEMNKPYLKRPKIIVVTFQPKHIKLPLRTGEAI